MRIGTVELLSTGPFSVFSDGNSRWGTGSRSGIAQPPKMQRVGPESAAIAIGCSRDVG